MTTAMILKDLPPVAILCVTVYSLFRLKAALFRSVRAGSARQKR